jgi:hypothetical protein
MRILAWPNQVLFGGLFESLITPWPYAGFSPQDLVKNSTLRNGMTNQICRVMAGFTDPEIDPCESEIGDFDFTSANIRVEF